MNLFKFVSSIVVMLTLGLYLGVIYVYTGNGPINDDVDSILRVLQLHDGNVDFFNYLFSFHNEHKIVISKIVALFAGFFYCSGEFYFTQVLVGFFMLLSSMLILYKNQKHSYLSLAVIFLIGLNLNQYELISWPMASTQQYSFIFCSILTISALSKGRINTALFFLFLTSLGGGGFVAIFPLFYIHLLSNKSISREYYRISFALLLILLIYFFVPVIYKAPSHPFPFDIIQSVKYFFVLIGSFFSNKYSFAFGVMVFPFVVYLMVASPLLINKYLVSFVLSVFVILVLFRSGFGVEQALSSRYKPYVNLLYSIVFIEFFNFLRRGKHNYRYILISTSIVVIFYCYLKELRPASVYLSNQLGQINSAGIIYPDPNVAKEAVEFLRKISSTCAVK